MKKMLALLLVLAMFSGCSTTTVAKDYNGLGTPAGKAVHVSTSNIALHWLLGKTPISGDASLEKTVDDFTAAAKKEGASKVQISQSSSTKWWWVFFPFSLLVTPVTSNVAGDAIS